MKNLKTFGILFVGGCMLVASGCTNAGSGTSKSDTSDSSASSVTAEEAPSLEEACASVPSPMPLKKKTKVVAAMPVKVQNFNALLMADALGELKKENVELDVKLLQNPNIVTLLGQGKLDIGVLGLNVGLLNAITAGLSIKWVAGFNDVQPDDQAGVYVRSDWVEDPSNFDWDQLKGKKFGMGVGGKSTQQILDVINALDKGGLTLDDVNLIELDSSDNGTAMKTHAVDAIIASSVEQILAEGTGVKVAGFTPITAGGYFYSEALTSSQRDVGSAVMRAMVRTQCNHLSGDYYSDPATMKALVETLAAPESTVRTQPPLTFNLRIAPGSFDALQDTWEKIGGLLTSKSTIDESDIVDQSIYAEAVEQGN